MTDLIKKPRVRPGRWMDGVHTQFARTHDGSVRFDLTVSEVPSRLITGPHLLSGWVEGFGTRKEISKKDNHSFTAFGPYECQHWLEDVLPQPVLDNLTFDSESNDFYCYSKDRESLKVVWEVLADTVVQLNALTDDYHSEMLKVLNGH